MPERPSCSSRLIRINPLPLRIFTNGLAVARSSSTSPTSRLRCWAGNSDENASLVGPQAEAMLESLWFDQLFLSASAVGPGSVIYNVDSAEANLNKRMLSRAAQSFCSPNSAKFGTMATYRVAPLTAAGRDGLRLSSAWRDRLEEWRSMPRSSAPRAQS